LNLEALRTEFEETSPEYKKKLSKEEEKEPFQLLEQEEDALFEINAKRQPCRREVPDFVSVLIFSNIKKCCRSNVI
jgi:hypothetical protein